MERPVIGVVPLWDEKKNSLWMLPGYFSSIEEVGGIPVMLPLTTDASIVRRLVRMFDGFLLTGGQDVHPSLYGKDMLQVCEQPCTQRDEMERILFVEAFNGDKPIFGICRGIQLINVLLGGSLFQDIPSQTQSLLTHSQQPPYDLPVHEVKIIPDTPLHKLFGVSRLPVNSYHHQGVRTLSSSLKIMAKATDGLIEAVYSPEKTFVWAVQWHPEFSPNDPASRALFKTFVRACEGKTEIESPYSLFEEPVRHIRVIDRTLSCLDPKDVISKDKSAFLQFINFLIKMEVDAIELSQEMFDLLSPLPEYSSYIITSESTDRDRIHGYDNEMCSDYQHTFTSLMNSHGEKVEFYPGDSMYCATALAVEWVKRGGDNVVTMFGGIDGFAATEEVIMALRTYGLRKADKDYDFLPQMTELFCQIAGEGAVGNIAVANKPVIGEKIFYVESGVHVDGIMKQPKCYEPFPPEVVGQKRKIVLGKQSGSASIRAMLDKLGITCAEENIPLILEQVKARAVKNNGAVTEHEFSEIVKECKT